MPKTAWINCRVNYSLDANTRHAAPMMGTGQFFLTEALQAITFREAGTLSDLVVRVVSNDHTSVVFTSRKNANPGNLTVSYGASETGEKRDTTNSDTIAAGDSVAFRGVATGGTACAIRIIQFVFTTASGRVVRYANGASIGVNFSSETRFLPLSGRQTIGTVEADRRFKALTSGTLKSLFVLGTNGGANPMTVGSQINGAPGNLAVTIGAGGSNGEDTTHTDTVVAGDQIGYYITTGAGMISSTFTMFAVEFVGNNDEFQYVSFAESVYLAGDADYTPIAGDLFGDSSITESDTQARANIDQQRLRKLGCFVSANTLTASSTITLRRNGANTVLALTIPSGGTGYFSDDTNYVVVAKDDLLDYQIVTGGTGTDITLTYITMLADERRKVLLSRF